MSLIRKIRLFNMNVYIHRIREYIKYQMFRWQRFSPQNLILSVRVAFRKNEVIAWWYETKMSNATNNFGDALNPILIKWLCGRQPIHARKIINFGNKPIFFVIGSILEMAKAKQAIIWGSGFMHEDGRLRQSPEKVLAIRGPLSRAMLLDQGISCPEIYGDPALLCPRFYQPKVEIKYKLGIIPHHNDKENPLLINLINNPETKLIDVQSGVLNVIDEICSCEYIASSSLHGIIVADAYKIPSIWINPSNKYTRKGFKFKDYFASVGRNVSEPIVITDKTTTADLIDHVSQYKINIDLNKLLETCPLGNWNSSTPLPDHKLT